MDVRIGDWVETPDEIAMAVADAEFGHVEVYNMEHPADETHAVALSDIVNHYGH